MSNHLTVRVTEIQISASNAGYLWAGERPDATSSKVNWHSHFGKLFFTIDFTEHIHPVWLHLSDCLLNKNASICFKGTPKNLHGSSVLLSSKRNKPASIKNRTHKLAVAHPVQCSAARKSPEYWNAHNGRLQLIWSWVQEFGHKAILVYLKSQKETKWIHIRKKELLCF